MQTSDNQIVSNSKTTSATATAPAKSVPQASVTTAQPATGNSPQPITKAESTVSNDIANVEDVLKSDEPTEPEVPTADEFFIPSAFTPNGDGLNDLFYVKANFEPKSYELSIFNRNGDLVFITRDLNTGWDGSLHGKTLAHGMYVYVIKYRDTQGVEQKKQGQVLLIP